LIPRNRTADAPDVTSERMIMNVPDVADFLRVSESTIRKLVKERRIPYFKLEGRYLFYRGALEKWASDLTIEVEKGSTKGEASQKAEEIWTSKEEH
jgi:excisionase family DNA binding protein